VSEYYVLPLESLAYLTFEVLYNARRRNALRQDDRLSRFGKVSYDSMVQKF
jgi:hypothetical protein